MTAWLAIPAYASRSSPRTYAPSDHRRGVGASVFARGARLQWRRSAFLEEGESRNARLRDVPLAVVPLAHVRKPAPHLGPIPRDPLCFAGRDQHRWPEHRPFAPPSSPPAFELDQYVGREVHCFLGHRRDICIHLPRQYRGPGGVAARARGTATRATWTFDGANPTAIEATHRSRRPKQREGAPHARLGFSRRSDICRGNQESRVQVAAHRAPRPARPLVPAASRDPARGGEWRGPSSRADHGARQRREGATIMY